MKPIIFIAFLGLLNSCEKDKTPLPCKGVSMTGERELFVGKWRWYSTVVEEWFDVGDPIYHDYTPQNQGFEYYFTLEANGTYRGFRNDTLIHDFILNRVDFENFNGTINSVMDLRINCTNDPLELVHFNFDLSNDSILVRQYPLSFSDDANHLETKMNFFVKE